MEIDHFPETAEDAADILNVVRSNREACNHRKLAAEHAVHQTIVHLKVLMCKASSTEAMELLQKDLRKLYKKLLVLDKGILEADQKIGAVRTILGQRGLPVALYTTQLYNRQDWGLDPPTEFQFDDSSETSSVESDSIVSNMDSRSEG